MGTIYPTGPAVAFQGHLYNLKIETGLVDRILRDFIDHLFP